jgi:hypothetical protein
VCAPEQGSCQANSVVTCNEVGDGYASPQACAAEQTCKQAGISAACEDWVCVADSAYCEEQTAIECSANGLSVVSSTDCALDGDVCQAGECLEPLCTPGDTQCNEAKTAVETCKEDSLGFVSQDCPGDSTICEAGVCASIICDANASYCDGTTVLQCNGTGTSAEELATCDETTEACVGGACVSKICAPGDAVCNGISEVQTCNGDGLGYTSANCGAGLACKDGACELQICTPNALLCEGTEVQLCDGLGLEVTSLTDCVELGKVCVDGLCTDQLCSPDTTYCEGQIVTLCNADGTAMSVQQTCGATQFCEQTGNSASCTTEGFCTSLSFDGGDDYLDLEPEVQATFVAPMTLEVWIKPQWGEMGPSGILMFTDDFQFDLRGPGTVDCSPGQVRFKHGSGNYLCSDVLIEGQWHHVAVTVSEDLTMSIWSNGALSDTKSSAPAFEPGAGSVTVGAEHYGGGLIHTYAGRLSNMRFSASVRYTEVFTPAVEFSMDTATIGLWRLDDGAGSVAMDASGGDYHGSISGATWVNDCP